MNVANTAMDFKREHPHNYWIRILCLAFIVVFLALWASGDAEGLVVEEIEDASGASPYATGFTKGTHTKDNVLVTVYRHQDDELWIGYQEDGEDWNQTVIDDTGSSYMVGGAVSTSNGSVVVLATFITVTYPDVYMFIHWPSADWDDWYRYSVYSGTGRYAASISINDTDNIFLLVTKTTSPYQLNYWMYDFPSMTKVAGGLNGAVTHGGGVATSQYYSTYAVVNVTGRFHIFHRSATYTYHHDLDGVYGVPYIVYGSKYYLQGVLCLPNDRFVGFGLYDYSGKAFISYQDAHEDETWTRVWADTAQRGYTSMSGSMSTTYGSLNISMIAYCTSGGAAGLTTWTGPWNSDETFWNNIRHEEEVTDDDYWRAIGSFGELFPKWRPETFNLSFTQPGNGYVFLAINESGTPDEFDLLRDGDLRWTPDLTPEDPEITTSSLPEAEFDVFWSYTLERDGGSPAHLWNLLIGPGWMSLGEDNGTLYGTPDGTGTEEVRVKLADAVPRYDERQWTLTIGTGSEGGDVGDDGPICASTWMMLAVMVLMFIVFIGWAADTMF